MLLDFLLLLFTSAMLCPVAFFSSCSACCNTCVIFSDEYGSDALTADYDTISGTWAVAAGVLTTTTSDALLVAKSLHPDGTESTYTKATIKCSSTSTAGRLVGNYQDSSNYWYAQVQPGAFSTGTLKLFQVAAGVATQIGSTTTVPSLGANVNCVTELCFYNSRVTATAQAGGGIATLTAAATITGDRSGVGSGTVGGIVTIDDFSFEKHAELSAGCNACLYCDVCTGGDEPYRIQVDLEGTLNDAGACDCDANFIGTFICERYNSCEWRYYFPGSPCGMDYLVVLFVPGFFGANGNVVVDLIDTLGNSDTFWNNAATPTPFDCRTLNRLNVPKGAGSSNICHNPVGPTAFAYLTSL